MPAPELRSSDGSGRPEPEVVPVGTGFWLLFNDPIDPRVRGITVTVTQLHDHFPHLYAHVDVRERQQSVEWGAIDLLSARDRADMARRLSLKGRWPDMLPAWGNIVDQTAEHVLNHLRAESDFVLLDGQLMPAPPRRHILEPVLPDQVPTLIYGQGGSFKSTLLTAILVSIASGREVIRGWKPRLSSVAYLDWESSVEVVDGRRRALARGAGIEPPSIHYRRMTGSLSARIDELADLVDELRIECIGVDSVGMALGAHNGGDANESTLAMFAAMRLVPVAWILVDHVTGDDMRFPKAVPKPYGSVYKFNLARAAYELRAEADPTPPRTQLLLRQAKAEEERPRQGPIGLAVIREPEVIRFDVADVTAPDLLSLNPATSAERIEGLLASKGALSVPDIAEQLDLKVDSVRAKLHAQKKRFVKLSDGRWGLAQHG